MLRSRAVSDTYHVGNTPLTIVRNSASVWRERATPNPQLSQAVVLKRVTLE